jgi:hypothetical protein
VMLKCSWKLFVKTVLRLFCDVSNSILKPWERLSLETCERLAVRFSPCF